MTLAADQIHIVWFENDGVLIAFGCFLALLVAMGGCCPFRAKIRAVNLSFAAVSICVNGYLLVYFVRDENSEPLTDWRVLVCVSALLATLAGMAMSLTTRGP